MGEATLRPGGVRPGQRSAGELVAQHAHCWPTRVTAPRGPAPVLLSRVSRAAPQLPVSAHVPWPCTPLSKLVLPCTSRTAPKQGVGSTRPPPGAPGTSDRMGLAARTCCGVTCHRGQWGTNEPTPGLLATLAVPRMRWALPNGADPPAARRDGQGVGCAARGAPGLARCRKHGTAEPARRNSADPDPALPAAGRRPAGRGPHALTRAGPAPTPALTLLSAGAVTPLPAPAASAWHILVCRGHQGAPRTRSEPGPPSRSGPPKPAQPQGGSRPGSRAPAQWKPHVPLPLLHSPGHAPATPTEPGQPQGFPHPAMVAAPSPQLGLPSPGHRREVTAGLRFPVPSPRSCSARNSSIRANPGHGSGLRTTERGERDCWATGRPLFPRACQPGAHRTPGAHSCPGTSRSSAKPSDGDGHRAGRSPWQLQLAGPYLVCVGRLAVRSGAAGVEGPAGWHVGARGRAPATVTSSAPSGPRRRHAPALCAEEGSGAFARRSGRPCVPPPAWILLPLREAESAGVSGAPSPAVPAPRPGPGNY